MLWVLAAPAPQQTLFAGAGAPSCSVGGGSRAVRRSRGGVHISALEFIFPRRLHPAKHRG